NTYAGSRRSVSPFGRDPERSAAEQFEADAAAPAAPAVGCVTKQLRGAAASLALPFVGGFDEERRLEGAAETCLVQPPSEQEFVDRLQFAEREGRAEEPEGDGGAVHAFAQLREGGVDNGAVPRCHGRQVAGRKPVGAGRGPERARRRDADVRHGERGGARMPAPVRERAGLCEPARARAGGAARDARGGVIERFARGDRRPGEGPSFARPL